MVLFEAKSLLQLPLLFPFGMIRNLVHRIDILTVQGMSKVLIRKTLFTGLPFCVVMR